MAKQIQRAHRGIPKRRSSSTAKLAGEKADAALIAAIERNINNGRRVWREILIAIELCSCYFAKSKGAFFKHLAKARQLMLDTVKALGPRPQGHGSLRIDDRHRPVHSGQGCRAARGDPGPREGQVPLRGLAGIRQEPRALQRDPPAEQAVRVGAREDDQAEPGPAQGVPEGGRESRFRFCRTRPMPSTATTPWPGSSTCGPKSTG